MDNGKNDGSGPQPLPPDAPYTDPATGKVCDPGSIIAANPEWERLEQTLPVAVTGRSPLFVRPDTPPERYPTNLPDTPWGRAVRVNAENASDYMPDRHGIVEIETMFFLVFPSTRSDRTTGDEEDCIRTALIDRNGVHISTTSDIVRKRLLTIIGHHGWGPWDPPLRLCLSSRRCKSGDGSYHQLSEAVGPEKEGRT